MASKLIGTRVVSANNESIGDVNDVVLDRGGSAQAVVIGVGGFLGIGEKNVAVPFRSLEFASSRDANTTGSTGATGATSGTGGGTSGSAAESDIDRVVLRMTKAELQAAPAFQNNRSGSVRDSATSRPGGSGSGSGTGGSGASGSGATR